MELRSSGSLRLGLLSPRLREPRSGLLSYRKFRLGRTGVFQKLRSFSTSGPCR
jgi:hypothetical protein